MWLEGSTSSNCGFPRGRSLWPRSHDGDFQHHHDRQDLGRQVDTQTAQKTHEHHKDKRPAVPAEKLRSQETGRQVCRDSIISESGSAIIGITGAPIPAFPASTVLSIGTALGGTTPNFSQSRFHSLRTAFTLPSDLVTRKFLWLPPASKPCQFGTGWDGLDTISDFEALSGEAICLARGIVEQLPEEPEPKGLLALMLYRAPGGKHVVTLTVAAYHLTSRTAGSGTGLW